MPPPASLPPPKKSGALVRRRGVRPAVWVEGAVLVGVVGTVSGAYAYGLLGGAVVGGVAGLSLLVVDYLHGARKKTARHPFDWHGVTGPGDSGEVRAASSADGHTINGRTVHVVQADRGPRVSVRHATGGRFVDFEPTGFRAPTCFVEVLATLRVVPSLITEDDVVMYFDPSGSATLDQKIAIVVKAAEDLELAGDALIERMQDNLRNVGAVGRRIERMCQSALSGELEWGSRLRLLDALGPVGRADEALHNLGACARLGVSPRRQAGVYGAVVDRASAAALAILVLDRHVPLSLKGMAFERLLETTAGVERLEAMESAIGVASLREPRHKLKERLHRGGSRSVSAAALFEAAFQGLALPVFKPSTIADIAASSEKFDFVFDPGVSIAQRSAMLARFLSTAQGPSRRVLVSRGASATHRELWSVMVQGLGFGELMGILAHSDMEPGLKALVRMRLAELLLNDVGALRRVFAERFSQFGVSGEAVRRLIERIAKEHSADSVALTLEVTQGPTTEAVELERRLVAYLGVPNPRRQTLAADILAVAGSRHALSALRASAVAKAAPKGVRRACLLAVDALEMSEPVVRYRRELSEQAIARQPLLAKYRSRIFACFSAHGDSEAVSAMVNDIFEPPADRLRSLEQRLIDRLQEPSANGRDLAAKVLGIMGTARAIESLTTCKISLVSPELKKACADAITAIESRGSQTGSGGRGAVSVVPVQAEEGTVALHEAKAGQLSSVAAEGQLSEVDSDDRD